MKTIEIDDQLYQYIASQTTTIGESASDILRRLLLVDQEQMAKSIEEASAAPAVKEQVAPKKTASASDVFDLLNKGEIAAQKGAVGRFMHILSALYRAHEADFDKVLEIRGRNRLYFAKGEDALMQNGSSTNPKNIANSEFWVVTNSNTTKKKLMLTEVARVLGYQDVDIEKIRELI